LIPPPVRCRSSVVEHSIGNGEVDSSILSGSTIFYNKINASHEGHLPFAACQEQLHAEQGTKWRALPCREFVRCLDAHRIAGSN
jgi:hypothetical protein